MTVIAFAPKHNAPGKRDADEFKREARRFVEMHGGKLYIFDNRLPFAKRRVFVQRKLKQHPEHFQCLAFFCHGWRTGIQAGYRIADTRLLGKTLSSNRVWAVALYCCSVAQGPDAGNGSFASMLCRNSRYVTVYGHDRKGHTTRNPHVWAYDYEMGGVRPIARDSKLWPKWVKALKGDYRLQYPLQFPDEHEHCI